MKIKIKVYWTMHDFGGAIGRVPLPNAYATAEEMEAIKSYAHKNHVVIRTKCGPQPQRRERAIGSGGEAQIFFEGNGVNHLLYLSELAMKTMLDHQYGVSNPIIPRRKFVGEGASTLNVLLKQIDAYKQALRRILPKSSAASLARSCGAIIIEQEIDELFMRTPL